MGNAAHKFAHRKPGSIITQNVIEEVTGSGPADAVAVAAQLPEPQRAVLAQFCYGRRHLRHLGLMIAGTLSKQALMETFGGAWEVIYKQAQDPDKTLASEKRPTSELVKRSVTLPTVGANPPASVDEDWDDEE